MRASELLTALTLPSQGQELQQLLLSINGTPKPCSGIDYQGDRLILIADNNQLPLPMPKLLTALMTHRPLYLFYMEDNALQPIYGFKEEGNALIL